MKKVNFKKVLLALVAVFTLMVFGVEQAEAQAINEFSTGLYDPAPGTFLGADPAKDLLVATITDLKESTTGMTPGTPAYEAVRKTALYYSSIYNVLLDGKTVSVAIGTGLTAVSNTADNYPGRSQLMTLRQGAIDLLQ